MRIVSLEPLNHSALGIHLRKSSSAPASLRRMSNTPEGQGGAIVQSNTANLGTLEDSEASLDAQEQSQEQAQAQSVPQSEAQQESAQEAQAGEVATAMNDTPQGETPKRRSIYEVKLFSKYNNLKATFVSPTPTIPLPYTKGGEYFVYEDTRFYVCEGEGALYHLDYTQELDFTPLDIFALEACLLTNTLPKDTKQHGLIRQFLSISSRNIQKKCMYLVPRGYEAVWAALI